MTDIAAALRDAERDEIAAEQCHSLDAVIEMLRERREEGPLRALIPVHCACWYEQDEPCCRCGTTDLNLWVDGVQAEASR